MRLRISESIEQWNSGWLRLKHGPMTRRRLAREVGTGAARITDYDKGRKEPLLLRGLAVAEVLKVDIKDLVEE